LVFEDGFEIVDIVEVADVEKVAQYHRNVIL
jgi:hypothetical protein